MGGKNSIPSRVDPNPNPNPNSSIPEHLLTTEILTRLPPKSLIRFKSVSKQWLSTISSPKFAKLHLQRSITNLENYGILYQNRPPSSIYLAMNNTNYDAMISKTMDFDQLKVKLDHHGFPDKKLRVLGTSNGLLCVWVVSEGTIYVWNPVTRECRQIPIPIFLFKNYKYPLLFAFWGFGYIPSLDDYKLVMLQAPGGDDIDDGSRNILVRTFSLRSNHWREYVVDWSKLQVCYMWKCQSYDYYGATILSNSKAHWLLYSEWSYARILSFDLVTETFEVIPIPDKHRYQSQCLSSINDNLCIAREGLLDGSLEVWELECYGDWESWKITLKLSKSDGIRSCKGVVRSFVSYRSVDKNGVKSSMILLSCGQVWLIHFSDDDDEKQQCIPVEKLRYRRGDSLLTHVQSIVSPFINQGPDDIKLVGGSYQVSNVIKLLKGIVRSFVSYFLRPVLFATQALKSSPFDFHDVANKKGQRNYHLG